MRSRNRPSTFGRIKRAFYRFVTTHSLACGTTSKPNAPLSVALSASISPTLSKADTDTSPTAGVAARIGSGV